ncbi:hypothetical protein P170DRAFT_476255 [Aspergillus steynii IBT 23096]|uniref:Multicopper oxidase n=1 Tax=Aspergillus steynii IBT 23096 TaxID=1392250 RepID=A0A2I2G3X4_9EURO|nr:uncharacterized protein P170DRAFT_476255 [Aspergillus steynii IBT 23096]PLB47569.1 hypothetical protein P170DRAFT_476255 [Aspergillus steynii IBT 23096]
MILGRYFTAVINFFGFPPSLAPQQEVLNHDAPMVHKPAEPLSFIPPGAAESETGIIKCEYPDMMKDYDIADKSGEWLISKNPTKNPDFNIYTNYETMWPKGTVRKYTVTIEEKAMTLDGVNFPHAKVINGSWPGPWIQACWGDEVHVTVKNKLKYNGTAIHMHGIRMLDSNLNDGVPGVTQCPIAPGQEFTYNFTATQYGTTWYHSHYSLQYTDGVLGPLTIHGPTSADYDSPIDPIILGDHNHRSAFQDYYQEQFGGPPKMTSILINGKGSYAGSYPDRRYTKHVKPGQRRLLRLINTSTDSTYIFSVDEHELEVIGVDLVPINPYTTKNITIGNGQRYHAILKTKTATQVSKRDSYWIRVQPAVNCHNFETFPDTRQGILWYGDQEKPPIPTTKAFKYNATCRDETGWSPVVPWFVPELPEEQRKQLRIANASVRLDKWNLPMEHGNETPELVNNWNMIEDPVWVNYTRPTVNYSNGPFGKNAVVYNVNASTGWLGWNYMVIVGGNQENPEPWKGGRLIPAAHPIHLHGHDFALLQQSEHPFRKSSLKLNYYNPPRRDVVLLPKNGFIVIAFKTDNPGPWVLHCHIAWHASAGLAFQALEEVDKFQDRIKHGTPQWQKTQLHKTCKDWNTWHSDKKNHYYPDGRFQDDSGI